MRENKPVWAPTALVELIEQGRQHPNISKADWYSIVAYAEDVAEEERALHVFEGHVRRAMTAYRDYSPNASGNAL